jgi:hypothetical protein
VCCRDRFDRDELGIDPEDDEDEICAVCLMPIDECECEESDDADLRL